MVLEGCSWIGAGRQKYQHGAVQCVVPKPSSITGPFVFPATLKLRHNKVLYCLRSYRDI